MHIQKKCLKEFNPTKEPMDGGFYVIYKHIFLLRSISVFSENCTKRLYKYNNRRVL